jgi:hypothetical protein
MFLSTKVFQIATGTGYAEECTDYITANNQVCINKAIKAAFQIEGSTLGNYVSHTLSEPNQFNQITVTITYLDQGELDTTEWQLRPLKAFL